MAMDAQRIPFTEEDERRIASAATWGMVVAICSIITSLISVVVTAQLYFGPAQHLQFAMGPMLVASGVFSLVTVLFNVWLLQASLAFRKVAITDEADQAHLLTGFRGLRAYFMAQVSVILLAVVGGIFMAVVR
jgi:hypothetical protein